MFCYFNLVLVFLDEKFLDLGVGDTAEALTALAVADPVDLVAGELYAGFEPVFVEAVIAIDVKEN